MKPYAQLCLVLFGGFSGILAGGCQSTIRFATTESQRHESPPSMQTAWQKELWQEVQRRLGTPYCYGGTKTACTDCSGFVQQVFAALGVALPRTSAEQARAGSEVHDEPLPGDLVIVLQAGSVRHVGIYLGNGQVAHASRSRGVVLEPLSALSSIGSQLRFRRVLPPQAQ
jgi:cell wall-associated NlpC family hydrolase